MKIKLTNDRRPLIYKINGKLQMAKVQNHNITKWQMVQNGKCYKMAKLQNRQTTKWQPVQNGKRNKMANAIKN